MTANSATAGERMVRIRSGIKLRGPVSSGVGMRTFRRAAIPTADGVCRPSAVHCPPRAGSEVDSDGASHRSGAANSSGWVAGFRRHVGCAFESRLADAVMRGPGRKPSSRRGVGHLGAEPTSPSRESPLLASGQRASPRAQRIAGQLLVQPCDCPDGIKQHTKGRGTGTERCRSALPHRPLRKAAGSGQ